MCKRRKSKWAAAYWIGALEGAPKHAPIGCRHAQVLVEQRAQVVRGFILGRGTAYYGTVASATAAVVVVVTHLESGSQAWEMRATKE